VTTLDRVVIFVLAIMMITGGYQFYFWCQRHPVQPFRSLQTRIDPLFVFSPHWVWVYVVAYYPVILYVVVIVPTMRIFVYTAFSYFMLLAGHMLFFVFFPVAVPETWREHMPGAGVSYGLLRIVRHLDAPSNCFPSMHVSVATLTALHITSIRPEMAPWITAFPFLVGISAVCVKQHFVLDLVPGAMLGWLSFRAFEMLQR
jgi:membrane-associated phospholipid phosphatase